MVSVAEYPEVERSIIEAYAALEPTHGEVEVETVFDDRRGHDELV